MTEFLAANIFTSSTQQERDLFAFLLAFGSESVPCIGRQQSVDSDNKSNATVISTINTLIAQAATGGCDLIIKGSLGGVAKGYVYNRGTSLFDPDSLLESGIAESTLRASVGASDVITYSGVAPGAGRRLGIDRDRDTFLDRTELAVGTDLGEESPDLRQGLEAMQRNDLPAALASLERMVGDDPDSEFVPLAYALIARIHWTHGEPVEMVRAFARMFASVKGTVPAYKTLAHQLERYASGDATVTKSFADLAQNGDEGFRHIYQYLAARTLLEQDQFDATHTALEELRRRHPDGDFTHIVDLEQAWNLLRHGQAAEALGIFQRLQQQPPPARAEAFDAFFDLRSEIPMGIARCHFALGQYAEAARLFEQAIATQPHSIYDVENRLSLALSYEGLNQFDHAAEILRDVIAAHPNESNLWALRQQLARIEGHGKVRQ